MTRTECRIATFVIILLTVMTLSSVVATWKTVYPDGNPVIEQLLERKVRQSAVPVPGTEICIWLKTHQNENARCVEPDERGQITATMPGPDGQGVAILYQHDDRDLRITITPPGAFPAETDE